MELELDRLKIDASQFSRPSWPAESIKEFVVDQQHFNLTAWLSLATTEVAYDSIISDEPTCTERATPLSPLCMYIALHNRMRLAYQHMDNSSSSSSSSGKCDNFCLSQQISELCSMLLILKMLVFPPKMPSRKLMSPVNTLLLSAIADLGEDVGSSKPSEQLSQPAHGSAQLVTAIVRLIMVTFEVGMEVYWQLDLDLNGRKCSLPLNLLRCFSVLSPSQQEAAAAEIGSSGEPPAVRCLAACKTVVDP